MSIVIKNSAGTTLLTVSYQNDYAYNGSTSGVDYSSDLYVGSTPIHKVVYNGTVVKQDRYYIENSYTKGGSIYTDVRSKARIKGRSNMVQYGGRSFYTDQGDLWGTCMYSTFGGGSYPTGTWSGWINSHRYYKTSYGNVVFHKYYGFAWSVYAGKAEHLQGHTSGWDYVYYANRTEYDNFAKFSYGAYADYMSLDNVPGPTNYYYAEANSGSSPNIRWTDYFEGRANPSYVPDEDVYTPWLCRSTHLVRPDGSAVNYSLEIWDYEEETTRIYYDLT